MEYTTNDLSRILDVFTNTIRRFEQKGYLSSDRNAQNGYRKFTHVDVEKLMYVAKYRKLGFAHEEIAEIFTEDLAAIAERFERKKEELDAEIFRLQALSHMLKDDIGLMKRVEECGSDVIEMNCSPVHYVLYQKAGSLCISGEQAETLHRFMSTCTEFEYLYLFDRADVEAGNMVYSEGVGAHQRCTLKYHVDVSAPVEAYESRPCLLKFMRVPLNFQSQAEQDPKGLYQFLFGDFLKYMEEHGLRIMGDAMALKVGYAREEAKEWQYILLHLPVGTKES